MEVINQLENEYTEHKTRINKIIQGFLNKLKENPPKEKGIYLSDNIMIIKFKDLQNNWSPEYYNFRYQYELIALSLKINNPSKSMLILKRILKEGKIHQLTKNSFGNYVERYDMTLHPEVIKSLKEC